MATVTHNFAPSDNVFVLIPCNEDNKKILTIRKGQILRVSIEILKTESTIKYDVKITDIPGSTVILQKYIFSTEELAVNEYKKHIT